MIIQPGTVYEPHRIYLLKDGIDQTGSVVLTGTWTYNDNGYLYSETHGSMIEYPVSILDGDYIYFDMETELNNGTNWIRMAQNGGFSNLTWYTKTGSYGAENIGYNVFYQQRKSACYAFSKTANRTGVYNRYLVSGGGLRVYNIYTTHSAYDFI